MTKRQMKDHAAVYLCFIISALAWIPVLAMFLPEGRFPPGSDVHGYFKQFYWGCVGANVILLFRGAHKTPLTSAFGAFFGPISLTTMGLSWVYWRWLRKEDPAFGELANPTPEQDCATKGYVDRIMGGNGK